MAYTLDTGMCGDPMNWRDVPEFLAGILYDISAALVHTGREMLKEVIDRGK